MANCYNPGHDNVELKFQEGNEAFHDCYNLNEAMHKHGDLY